SVAPTKYYPLEETLYIEGIATSLSEVELFFEKPDRQPVRLQVAVNSNGEWFFADRLELARGEWTVRARVINNPGISDWSNPRIIRSVVSGFLFGSIKIRYVPIILLLIFILALGIALFVYSVLRIRKIQRLVFEQETRQKTEALEQKVREKEHEATQAHLEQDFNELRESIMEELEHLEKRHGGKRLSAEEENHREKLFKDLRECEEKIEKRLNNMT
ncbi:hypothetical protein IIA95_00480, partial [Patescibacteria group bacterium]|nr:hypothetical protein [Patescibacteria group bacterium]